MSDSTRPTTDASHTAFVPVAEAAAMDALFSRSVHEPVLVFKHDPWCIISVVAHRELSQLGGEIPTVDVAGARELSLGLAERTGVRHESPQVLILRDGEAVWSASHGAITAAAVARALETGSPTDR